MASMYEVEKQLEAMQKQLEVIAALLGINTNTTTEEPITDPDA